jgi:hypothetical protein
VGRNLCECAIMSSHDFYVGYFVCYGTVRLHNSVSWRFPFGMQAVAGSIFSAGSLFLPHSPRWLKHVGREAEATAAWSRLGFSNAEAEKELEATQRIEEEVNDGEKPWWDIIKQLLDKRVRKRTLLGCFLMASQQVWSVRRC